MNYKNFSITLHYKVLFMIENNQHLESIKDIRQLMQKSSRFISLSGLSGVAAGLCALVAAWVVYRKLDGPLYGGYDGYTEARGGYGSGLMGDSLTRELLLIAAVTFAAAASLAFLFTYIRSRKVGMPIWGFMARRVMIAVAVPMIMGGLVIWRMMEMGYFGLLAPVCLIFYGLGLVNASKYTLSEIRYLGYGQLILGAINLWYLGSGLYFWAAGFGVLHIIYGIVMWNRYERTREERA